MAKVVAVLNQKGGEGKSTVAANVAIRASEMGKSVLLIETDTQGNSSMYVSGDMRVYERDGGSEQLFQEGKDFVYGDTLHPNMKMMHGHIYLDAVDLLGEKPHALAQTPEMRKRIRSLPFDLVVFDTPPNLGIRQVAPLFWAHLAVIVVQPSQMSLPGLQGTARAVKQIQAANPVLKQRLVINLMNKSRNADKRICGELAEAYRGQVVAQLSNRSVVKDALEQFKPVWGVGRDKALRAEWKQMADSVLSMVDVKEKQ